MAPDRRLDLDLPALIRLADLALEADLDLIYAKDRSTECFLKANEYQEYTFYSGDAARGYADRWLAAFLHDQLLLHRRCITHWSTYVALWRETDVRRREEIFIAARMAHAKDRGDRNYLLHCPELRMDKLCGGNGEGFIELLININLNKDDILELRNSIPIAPKRLKHAQWDRWFGFDEAASDQLPLPVGLRGFAINVMVFRMGLLIGTALMMLDSLVEGGAPKPYIAKVAELNHREDIKESYETSRIMAQHETDPDIGARIMASTFEDYLASASN
ncbi:hypothetical protein RQP46_003060 [Phenoliferia psychrophenolica]